MRIITAPERFESLGFSCFLAGGITNCPDWQKQVINYIKEYESKNSILERLNIYNPRRENFPIHVPTAAQEQIRWEYNYLNYCDIFSMYFCNSPSDQPICMYELGRYLLLYKQLYPASYEHRIIISIENGYKREQDVIIQTELATKDMIVPILNATPETHAQAIIQAYSDLLDL